MFDGNRADLRTAAHEPDGVSGGAKVGGAHIEERSQQGTERLLDVWEDEGGSPVSPARIVNLQSTDERCPAHLIGHAGVQERIEAEHIEAQESTPEQDAWQPRIERESEINAFVNKQNLGAQLASSLPSTEPETAHIPQSRELRV